MALHIHRDVNHGVKRNIASFLPRLTRVVASSTHTKSQHAAIVYRGNRILGCGYNRGAIQYGVGRFVAGRHAEVDAIINAVRNLKRLGKRLRSFKIVVVRDGMRMSHPCSQCAPFTANNGCRRVVYSAGNGSFETMNPANGSCHVSYGLCSHLELAREAADEEGSESDLDGKRILTRQTPRERFVETGD